MPLKRQCTGRAARWPPLDPGQRFGGFFCVEKANTPVVEESIGSMVSTLVEKGCRFSRKGYNRVESRESLVLVLKLIEMGRGAQVAWGFVVEEERLERGGSPGSGAVERRGWEYGHEDRRSGKTAKIAAVQLRRRCS